MDAYDIALTLGGVAILGAAVVPRLLHGRPLSFPLVYVLLGAAVFALPLGLTPPDPIAHGELTERITEIVVIVSLMGAGLKLDRPVGWRTWQATWRLLAVAMPLSIAAVALLGWWLVGLAPAAALLLGAALAPTDPVLASDVQVGGPGAGEEDDVRFTLTSEAGLNDALSFPFTNAAIAAATAAGGAWVGHWLLEDVLLKLAVGLVGGLVVGRLLGALAFRLPPRSRLAESSEGFVALAATLLAYGLTELAHGYGFLAVFVAAVTLRRSEEGHEFHTVLHDYAEGIERLLSAALLVLLGGAVVGGVLEPLGWQGVALGVVAVLAVRPLSGMASLAGLRMPGSERVAISFFGIRGIGSAYYLSHAVEQAEFSQADELWAVLVLVVLASIVLHGISAAPVLQRLDARRRTSAERLRGGRGGG